MFSRRVSTAPEASRGITQILQRSVIRRALPGDKTIYRTIATNETLRQELGVVYVPTEAEINNYTAEQLYEITFGGSTNYFASDVFKSQRSEEAEYLTGFTRNANVIESIYECPKCEYKRIRLDQTQSRSADESQTARYRCIRCNTPWSHSG